MIQSSMTSLFKIYFSFTLEHFPDDKRSGNPRVSSGSTLIWSCQSRSASLWWLCASLKEGRSWFNITTERHTFLKTPPHLFVLCWSWSLSIVLLTREVPTWRLSKAGRTTTLHLTITSFICESRRSVWWIMIVILCRKLSLSSGLIQPRNNTIRRVLLRINMEEGLLWCLEQASEVFHLFVCSAVECELHLKSNKVKQIKIVFIILNL